MFELAYIESLSQHFSHYVTETPHYRMKMFYQNLASYYFSSCYGCIFVVIIYAFFPIFQKGILNIYLSSLFISRTWHKVNF